MGHLKTVSILVTGVVLFNDRCRPFLSVLAVYPALTVACCHGSIGAKKLFGITCALIGVFWYSKIQLDKQNAAKTAMQPPAPTAALAAHKGDLESGPHPLDAARR